MKKLLALLLAMVMIVGMMAGCSKKKNDATKTDDTAKNAANQNESNDETGASTAPNPDRVFGVGIGSVLDAPEKIFNAETATMLYISFTVTTDGKDKTTEYSVVTKEDGTKLIYAVNGPGKNKEAIYEISDTMTKFIKGSSKDPFKPDDKTTAEDVKNEFNAIYDHLLTFTQCQDAFTGIKYRKVADVTVSCPTGAVYIYEALSGDAPKGLVCIDKDTGMFVKAVETETGKTIVVNEFKTTDVQIPEFTKDVTPPADGETPEAGTETETEETPETETEDKTEDATEEEPKEDTAA